MAVINVLLTAGVRAALSFDRRPVEIEKVYLAIACRADAGCMMSRLSLLVLRLFNGIVAPVLSFSTILPVIVAASTGAENCRVIEGFRGVFKYPAPVAPGIWNVVSEKVPGVMG